MDKHKTWNKFIVKFLFLAFFVRFTYGEYNKEDTKYDEKLFIFDKYEAGGKYEYGIDQDSFKQDNKYHSFSDLITCNETHRCANGGRCLHHSCLCLPGTSGPFCKTIDDCKNKQLCEVNEYTLCDYSVEKQKAYCRCRIMEYRFDEATRTCRTCVCSEYYAREEIYSYCEYQQGQQICVCKQGYSYNPKWKYCTNCDCGANSLWCAFDIEGKQMCGCKEGFVSSGYQCRECNCGPHGTCDEYPFNCICDEGYVQKKDKCVACSCGKYGECIFDNEFNQIACNCEPGYSEKKGKCEFCNCGGNSNCSFLGDQNICKCPAGFEDFNGLCVDINECEIHNPCDDSMTCINDIGSYNCSCKEGFMQDTVPESSSLVCKDIDECKQKAPCPQANTDCINTIGSYHCACESGYVSRGEVNNVAQCEKTQTITIYTIVVSITFIALVVALSAVVYLWCK